MADLVPNSFSWKTIQDCSIPIRDQDIVPCSWAFAAATLVSYQLKICDKEVWDFEPSVQYLIEHCNGESCNGEFSSQLYQQALPKTRQGTLAVLEYIEKYGVPLQTRIPYNGWLQVVFKSEAKGPIIRIHGIVPLPEYTPLYHIKKILMGHPIIASVEVYDSLLPNKFPKGEEDVYVKNTGLKVGPSHYLVIIGYGNQNGLDFYQVHNSWGVEWGNKGYGRILCQLVRPFAYVEKASIDIESAVGKKVAELHDMELDSEKPETEGGDVACCESKRVSELHDLEFNSEKPKLITDGLEVVQVEDDDVSPKVLYDRNSTQDDPHQFFTDLAELAINFFMKRNLIRRAKLVKLVKVTSVVINGVMLTLTMTADLKGNRDPEWNMDDQTLEAEILYRGSLVAMEDFHVIYVKVCSSNYIKRKETDNKLAKYKFTDSDSDWDEGELEPSLTNEQFVTQLAELAITRFNAHNPHMPYQVLGLLKFTTSSGYFINYTITMTAKPKPPHNAKSNAPVQTFEAIIGYQGDPPSGSNILNIVIVDPL